MVGARDERAMKKRLRSLYISALGALAVGCCVWAAAPAAAEPIYVVHGKNGVVTFTSHKPAEAAKFSVFQPTHAAFSVYGYWYSARRRWHGVPKRSEFDRMILDTARSYSLEPALVKAVVHAESAFNPLARSNKGAMGLMQLMPGTANRFGVWNAYRPEQNVDAGAKYLRWLLDRYSGNERLALAAYNAGEGAVDQFGTIPPYEETQTYVRRVLKLRELYRCVESGNKQCASSVVE